MFSATPIIGVQIKDVNNDYAKNKMFLDDTPYAVEYTTADRTF